NCDMRQELFYCTNILGRLEPILVFRNVLCNLNRIFSDCSKTLGQFSRSIIGHLFPPQISETIRGVRRDMMQITEPVTTLTDYALAAASLVFALFTARRFGPQTRVCVWFWCAAFIASGVAAALGGTYHGFSIYLDTRTRGRLWDVTLYLTGAAAAFITA